MAKRGCGGGARGRCGMKNGLFNEFFGLSSSQVYSAEAQAVFDRMSTPLSTALKNAIAAFVDSQVASGNWDKLVDYVRLDLDTEANSKIGFKGAFNPTFNNAYWTIYTGTATTGVTTSYINSGFSPNSVAAFGLNDAGFGVYVRRNNSQGSGSKSLFGVVETDNTRQVGLTQAGSAGSTLTSRLNSSSTVTYSSDNIFDDGAFYAVDRINATQSRIIKDGTVIQTSTANSGGKATIPIYIGARNNNNSTVDFPIDGWYRYYVAYNAVGFDYTSFINASNALNDAIDDLIGFVPLVFDIGQSNAMGRGEVNRLPLTSYTSDLPSVNIWYKSTYNTTNDGIFRRLIPGTNNVEPTNEATINCFGAEISLAANIFQNHSLPVYYIKAGEGGTSLGTSLGDDWDPDNTGENYDISVDGYLLPAITRLQLLYPGKTIKVFINWLQGETDATDTRADDYATNFPAFVTALRAEHSLLATAPLMITKLHYALTAGETTINNTLVSYAGSASDAYVFDVASQVTYPRKVDLPAGVKATYPPTANDDNHNSYEFQIKRGEMIYDKLVEIGFFN